MKAMSADGTKQGVDADSWSLPSRTVSTSSEPSGSGRSSSLSDLVR
jgi:hypothetical protein